MEEQQQEEDDSEEIPPKEWKELIENCERELKKVDIETFKKQFLEHPKKERFINWKDGDGWTMLLSAMYWERWDIAKLLLDHDVGLAATNKEGWTVLMYASFNGHNETVKLLLEKGADVTTVNNDGETALMYAAHEGHNESVKLLLKKGADITAATKKGSTALMLASEKGHNETVKLLWENGADITTVTKRGETALGLAVEQGHIKVVELLLAKGADCKIANKNGRAAFAGAYHAGHTNVLNLLLEKAPPNDIIHEVVKLLFNENAIKNVDIKTITQWIERPEKESFIDWKDDSIEEGRTMLLCSTRYHRWDIAKLLVERGADVNIASTTGETALMYASDRRNGDTVKLLFDKGADRNAISKELELTALMLASRAGYTEIVELLLDGKDADINIADKDGNTALGWAVEKGHTNVVELLLTKGVDCKITNRSGRTAFSTAYYACRTGIVNLLLEKAPLKDIIHEVVNYSDFADKFFELYQENREIVNWLDDDGRTVRSMSCKECREAILFMGQYDMDDQPMYESPTCQIYNALDYGGRDEQLKQPRAVAMKMMENEEHYLNEIRARRKDDGSPRFSSEFVTPYFAAYRADENPDFAKASKTWNTKGGGTKKLPDFCIPMPRGGRNLMESMNSENLSAKHKDLERRDILQKLCKIFAYLHGMGYIHGDVKPHNVVRHMGESVTWKAIDFDACTKIGDVVGLKLTTGSAPPEMLKIKGDQADTESSIKSKVVVLRQPGGDLDKADLVLADPSFDVWAVGILMYQLVTGRSFFHSDLQGNVDEAGLQELANLTQLGIHKKLTSVKDANARVLLSRILRLDPKERPTMSEIAEDYYFRPSDAPQGRKAEFFGKQVLSTDPKLEEKLRSSVLETSQVSKANGDGEESKSMEDIERSLGFSKSDFSYFKLRDEDKDWSDKLLNSEVEKLHFDRLGGMGEKPRLIDGDAIYQSNFLRSLLSSKGPDYFMGFLVEYFELYKIMDDAHKVCQGIKANLVSNAKDLKGIFVKLFVRGKGLNDVVRGTLFCNSVDQFKYIGRQLKERYGYNVYMKPPKKEAGAWPIPKLLIHGSRQYHGRCMSVEIQFSTVYMHLATHASNNHLVYEAIRESTGYLGEKDKHFQEFLQMLNEQYIDTEGFLRSQSAQEGRFEILMEEANEQENSGEAIRQESGKEYTAKSTGFITSGRICCGDQLFRFMSPRDHFQQFSECSFVVNKSLTLLSSHSYWSEESYNLEGKCVEFVVSFKGRGLAIAGIGTNKCLHGAGENDGGGTRCSVDVGRSKFVVRKSGIKEVFREKKLPNQERAKIRFQMQGGALLVSFVGSEREGAEEILETFEVSMPSGHQRYHLYMRAPPGVHDIKFHNITRL